MSRRQVLLLLTSIRFANLPSVVSNVWLGVALGVWGGGSRFQHLWLTTGLLTLAGLALYVSGNFLNDWHDRDWDARHRPERALPLGAFSPRLYLALAMGFAVVGVALACGVGLPSGVVAGLIVLCILGYTRWHKTGEWTVILMGLCRGLLPWLFLSHACWSGSDSWAGFLAVVTWSILWGGLGFQLLGLTLYIVALSQTARRETVSSGNDSITYSRFLFLLAGFSMAVIPVRSLGPYSLMGLLPFGGWILLCFTRFRQPVAKRVAALLAGLPLLDWIALLPISLWLLANRSPSAIDYAVTLVSHLLPPLAFIAGRLLKRLAPAT